MQATSLFPLEASVRDDSGRERLSFKVTVIEKKKIDEKSGLFDVPAGFYEIKRAPF